jgi:hypothetical protein
MLPLALLASWRFATSDALQMKCLLCRELVSRFQSDPFDSIPPPASGHCATNANDKLCLFIRDVISSFPTAANLSAFCRDIRACPPPRPANLIGISCNVCLALASHLLMHEPEARGAAFDYFCHSWKHETLVVCEEMLSDGLADVLGDLMEVNSSLGYCLAAHFCRKDADSGDKTKRRKSDDL